VRFFTHGCDPNPTRTFSGSGSGFSLHPRVPEHEHCWSVGCWPKPTMVCRHYTTETRSRDLNLIPESPPRSQQPPATPALLLLAVLPTGSQAPPTGHRKSHLPSRAQVPPAANHRKSQQPGRAQVPPAADHRKSQQRSSPAAPALLLMSADTVNSRCSFFLLCVR
jgi:hypothetical protein